LKATRTGGGDRAPFRLIGIGLGETAVASLEKGGRGTELASLDAPPSAFGFSAGFSSSHVWPGRGAAYLLNPSKVTFRQRAPDDLPFTFEVNNIYERWGADIKQLVRVPHVRWGTVLRARLVKSGRFEHEVRSGGPIPGSWGRLNRWGRRAPAGTYYVRIRVWLLDSNRAHSGVNVNSPPIDIK
jgi:hypothetical protein